MYSYYDKIIEALQIRTNDIDRITDQIYLGGVKARNPILLAENDIKHVFGLLTVDERAIISSKSRTVHFEPEYRIIEEYTLIRALRSDNVPIQEKFFDIEDIPKSKILPIIEEIRQYAQAVKPERILIHCRMGISRSATVVLGLLLHNGMSLQEAYDHVERIRPVINPNDGFRQALNDLESLIIKSGYEDH